MTDAIPSCAPPIARKRRKFPVVAEDHGYDTPCWIWQGAVNTAGYGTRGRPDILPTKLEQTHRAAYEFAFGAIDPDEVVHHLCEQKRCMNPNHMTVVTRAWHIRHHRPERFQGGHFSDTTPFETHLFTGENG